MTLFAPPFLCCFIVLLIVLALIKKEIIRQYILLVASVLFYATWDVRSLILIGICVLTVHFIVRGLFAQGAKHRGAILAAGIIILLTILGIFKYANFFIDSFCQLFSITDRTALRIALPAGISFYTFSGIGYMIDVYRREFEEKIPFYQEALYIIFFPKILQGPLEKAVDFFSQLMEEHPITKANLSAGIQMFLFGLVKKVVIADRLGLYVNSVYRAPEAYSGASLLLMAVSYTIQLYCDFSGYTDMALGIAKMLGYDLAPNFNLPFLSKNVAEYWRRWHMSLNIWFRDYLFYPILRSSWVGKIRRGMKQKAVSKKWINLVPSLIGIMIVWPLVGLWHGASWNYIVYGLIYGVMMAFTMTVDAFRKKKKEGALADVLRIFRTYVITLFLLILFRAPDFMTAWTVVKGIFTWQQGITYLYTWSWIYIPLVFLASIYAYRKNNGNSFYINLDLSKFKNMVLFWLVIFSIIAFMYVGESYFIYMQF